MNKIKNIAVIAFDNKKIDLIEWSYFNKAILIPHQVSAIGFAANILEGTLNKKVKQLDPGGYRSLCNSIESGLTDAVIIFGDAHEIFEKKELNSLIKTAIENNIIVAANKTTADFILHSSLLENKYATTRSEKKLIDKPEVVNANTIIPLAKAS